MRNFYRLNLSNCRVEPEKLEWFDELGSEFVPAMYTDMTIVGQTPPFRRMIVDTKYSALAESPYGGQKFKSPNLYQIYSDNSRHSSGFCQPAARPQ